MAATATFSSALRLPHSVGPIQPGLTGDISLSAAQLPHVEGNGRSQAVAGLVPRSRVAARLPVWEVFGEEDGVLVEGAVTAGLQAEVAARGA